MNYNYGTSGFRFHHTVIESIASRIGWIVAYLSSLNKAPYGIMITASHNPHEDNGVKIVNNKGEMINSEDERIISCHVNGEDTHVFKAEMHKPTIYIGRDTRESGTTIYNLILDGIMLFHANSVIHNLSIVTTPEFHYNMINTKRYIDTLKELLSEIRDTNGVTCDCANGVGSITCNELNGFKVINTRIGEKHRLNQHCGSDYVVNNRKIPDTHISYNTLYASLDGDADRVVFYFQDEQDFYLLNGDKISALIAYYISKTISHKERIVVIHTGYSNDAFVKFIHSLGIKTVCTATGVKHLHKEALKHDVSIYFESNGHGTVLFNNPPDELNDIQKFFHPTIGDGIMDMLAVLYILERTGLDLKDWNDLYTDNPYSLLKLHVKNKNDYIVTENELSLIQPIKVKNYIESLCDVNSRIFIRPSGTENYLRVYIESVTKSNVDQLSSKVNTYISDYTFHNIFEIDHLSKDDYSIEYFKLLGQLSSIQPKNISREDFNRFIERLNERHMIKVIRNRESKTIVGSITIFIEEKLIHNFGKVGHIEDVIVDKSARGYGLGKRLLETAKLECGGCYKIILDCYSENIEFYRKCGYEWKGNEMALYIK